MMTFTDRHCSLEPELDQKYSYDTYTTTANGRDVVPMKIVFTGAEWIEKFLDDYREFRGTDISEELIGDWQRKFDEMGLAYNCATQELNLDQLLMDRANKYFNNH